MPKRTVKQLEEDLRVARVEELAKRRRETVEILLDEALQQWEQQLKGKASKEESDHKYVLELFPNKDSKYQGLLQGAFPFIMRTPWTAEMYFTREVADPQKPIRFFANTLEELKPEKEKLLRLFGVVFFIRRVTLDFEYTLDYRHYPYPDMHQDPKHVKMHYRTEEDNYETREISVLNDHALHAAYQTVVKYEIEMYDCKELEKLGETIRKAKGMLIFAKDRIRQIDKIFRINQ